MPKNPPVKGRKPDYKIHALRHADGAKGEIGVAWNNPDGSLVLYFNPFVTVPSGPGFAVTAFPLDRPATTASSLGGQGPQGRDLDVSGDGAALPWGDNRKADPLGRA